MGDYVRRTLLIALLVAGGCVSIGSRYDISSHQIDQSHYSLVLVPMESLGFSDAAHAKATSDFLAAAAKLCAPARPYVIGELDVPVGVMATEAVDRRHSSSLSGIQKISGEIECR
jgi:hypothetical protein